MFPSLSDFIFNSLIVCFLIIFFFAVYNRITNSIIVSFTSLFNLTSAKYVEKNVNNQWERIAALCFLISLVAFVVTNITYDTIFYDELGGFGHFVFFFAIILVAVLYYFIKFLVVKTLSWVNNNNVFIQVNNMFFIYAVLFIIPVFLFFFITVLFPQISLETMLYPTLSIVLLIYVIYIIRGYQMIIANGFSHFFYILYLCTVELLPIIFFVHFIFN